MLDAKTQPVDDRRVGLSTTPFPRVSRDFQSWSIDAKPCRKDLFVHRPLQRFWSEITVWARLRDQRFLPAPESSRPPGVLGEEAGIGSKRRVVG